MQRSDPPATSHAFRALAAACATVATRMPGAAPSIDRGPIDSGPVDLAEIARLASRHRVTMLVLTELAHHILPRDATVAARLTARARARRMAALRRGARLAALSAALSAAGIRHLAIKGPVLAQQLHGDIGARDSKDIDLLVDPARIDAAATILHRLGFADVQDQGDHADDPFANKHRTFAGDGLEIEVHTRLIDVDALLPLPFEAVWTRREVVAIGSVPVATLSAVDTMLYLCAHGTSHLWFRLKWLEDIARIVAAGDPIIIDTARHRARAAGAEAIVLGALHLVEEVFGIVPHGGTVAGTRTSRALARVSRQALAAPADHASKPPLAAILRKLPVQFVIGRRWRYRYRLAQALLLAPRGFDVRGLPPGFGWLRLPLRPMMLLRHRLTRS